METLRIGGNQPLHADYAFALVDLARAWFGPSWSLRRTNQRHSRLSGSVGIVRLQQFLGRAAGRADRGDMHPGADAGDAGQVPMNCFADRLFITEPEVIAASTSTLGFQRRTRRPRRCACAALLKIASTFNRMNRLSGLSWKADRRHHEHRLHLAALDIDLTKGQVRCCTLKAAHPGCSAGSSGAALLHGE